jgi:hypothetical protein
VDSKIDHHRFSVARQLPAMQIVLDESDQSSGIVVLVIDEKASRGRVEVHMTDQRPGAQLVHHGVQTPDTVAVYQLNDGPHGISSKRQDSKPWT